MKKLLLLIALSTSIYGNAQTSCSGTVFTSGPNAFGTGGAINTYIQTCLTYNADLNTVLWTQRASPNWGFSGYTSGSIQTTWLNVSTNQWDSMILYTDATNLKGARYPGGTIFNPAGNTNIANSLMVGTGPAFDGANWIGAFYSSRQPSGGYHTVTSAQDDNNVCLNGNAPFGNIAETPYLGGPNSDIQQVGNKVLVAGGLCPSNLMTMTTPFIGGIIGKATYSSGNLTWSSDSIIPGFYNGSMGSLCAGSPRMVFAPDGLTGYYVFFGRLATSYGNNADNTISPIVYKTINGGTTWSSTPILPGFDWSVGHPEMLANVGFLASSSSGVFMPYAGHGIDLTVDSTGTLHLVSTVSAPLQSATIDSIAIFAPTYNWDYVRHRPLIWDMMTDGTTWNTLLVDSIKTAFMDANNADTSSYANPWPNNGYLGYGARIQVSRSVTGGKIFYSWTDSDSSITHTLYNSNPDIYMKSYDISNQIVTPTINETVGNGKCYFHYLSDISYYDNNIAGYVCPLVYTTDALNAMPPYNQSTAVNYNYLNCANFYTSQYTTPASVYRTQGPAGIATYSNNNSIKVYPNPSNGMVYIESLTNEILADVQITDVVGKQINHQALNVSSGKTSIDMSNLNSGVYFITVKTNNSSSTQKIVLQH